MAAQPALLLQREGILRELLPGIFARELALLLDLRRSARVSLMLTTLVGERLPEAETHGNFYRPARQDRAPEFTWRAQGHLETVVRQLRLDFLRHLGPTEMSCRVHVRLIDLEGTAGAVVAQAAVAAMPAAQPGQGDALPVLSVPVDERPLRISARATDETRISINDETTQRPLPAVSEWLDKVEEHAPARRTARVAAAPAPIAPPAVMVAAPGTRPSSNGTPLPGNLYQDYFGFERMPFNNTPDTHFFFPTPKHQEALSRLLWAISERKGFVMISGEIGAGKSTLCRTLLAQLPSGIKTALITHTHLDGKQLVRAIAEDLGIDTTGLNEYEIMQRMTHYLIQQLAAGHTVCIIIDEAQNLSPAALEEVRMISNIETEQEKLIQLILLGQPELREKVRLPEMTQLRQRIATAYHLEPLSREETAGYITHRLELAAPSRPLDFRKTAMAEAFKYSGGVPRLINTLCDNALLTAYSRDQRVITGSLMREAAADLELEPKRAGMAEFFKLW